MKRSKEDKMMLFIVYIDDIIITGYVELATRQLNKLLAAEFETQDLRQFRYFLGMEVSRTKEGIVVS